MTVSDYRQLPEVDTQLEKVTINRPKVGNNQNI